MSAITQALDHLFQSLARLEDAAAKQAEQTARAPRTRQKVQDDLFTAQVAANVAARDTAAIGARLDSMIDTLEGLLQEAA